MNSGYNDGKNFLGNSSEILAESIDDDQKQNKQTQVKPNQ